MVTVGNVIAKRLFYLLFKKTIYEPRSSVLLSLYKHYNVIN